MTLTAQINVDHVWGHITTPLPQHVLAYLDDKTKYHPDGYDRTWIYTHNKWDGFNHTFNCAQQTFRRGLLLRIQNGLEFHGYTVTVENCGPVLDYAAKYQLRDGLLRPLEYQTKIRQVVRDHMIGIIASPTGTGKSVMMGLVCDELRERTLIILNDLVLADQMYRNLTKYFPDAKIGYIGNSEFELGDITVATMNSLRLILGVEKRKKANGPHPHHRDLEDHIKTVGVILHDEVHLADSTSCVGIYDLFTYSPRRYGFSATPYAWAEKQQKYGNKELEGVFGHIIYSTFGLDFVALGMRVPMIVRSIEVPAFRQVYGTYRANQAKLYAECKKLEILENSDWAAAVVNATHEYIENGATAFVFAAHSLEYGARIAKLLNAPFVNGKTTRKERFRIFDAVQDKKLLCVVSDIGGVGLDIPSLDAFILASDVKDVRQMMGRVVRASPEKQDGHFVDIHKTCSFLKKHYELRCRQYTEAEAILM